jgi:hypothetical protein
MARSHARRAHRPAVHARARHRHEEQPIETLIASAYGAVAAVGIERHADIFSAQLDTRLAVFGRDSDIA